MMKKNHSSRMNEDWITKKNNKNDEYWCHRALPEMTKQIDDKIDWTKNRRRKWAWLGLRFLKKWFLVQNNYILI